MVLRVSHPRPPSAEIQQSHPFTRMEIEMTKMNLTILALTCGLMTTPAIASGIDGDWACAMAGVSVGRLSIADTSYFFSATGTTEHTSGNLILHRAELNGTVVPRVETGPLKDLFGAKTGYLDLRLGVLVFGISPQKWLSCTPTTAPTASL
jgi:hypothetical protein